MDNSNVARFAERRALTDTARTTVASVASLVVEILKDGVRGEEFARTFASAPGAQFSLLPEGSKQRWLDRGFRP